MGAGFLDPTRDWRAGVLVAAKADRRAEERGYEGVWPETGGEGEGGAVGSEGRRRTRAGGARRAATVAKYSGSWGASRARGRVGLLRVLRRRAAAVGGDGERLNGGNRSGFAEKTMGAV